MITISISSYNQAEFLPDAIESVLNQTKSPYWLYIIDDGSTDNSLEIAKKYERERSNDITTTPATWKCGVTVVSQVNKGLSSARNTALMQRQDGNFFLFLDADDILLPNCVERIEKEIYKNGYDNSPDIIGLSFKEFGMSSREVILMPNPTLEDFKTGNRIGYCSAIKKEALLEVGGYNPKMIWGAEDYDLWFDLLKRGKKIVTIPEILWLYRVKQSSMWTETQKHYDEYMAQIRKNHPEITW